MMIDLPGLLRERMPSGNYRYRVRVEGRKHVRVPLPVTPEHPNFMEYYRAARAGEAYTLQATLSELAVKHSLGWLTHEYIAAMRQMEHAGLLHRSTVHQRTQFLARLRTFKNFEGKEMAMPRSAVIKWRDSMMGTPGAADNGIKAVRAMFAWAIDQGLVDANPCDNVRRLNKMSTGATAWTLDNFNAFFAEHPAGTMPHLALTLYIYTACRVSDVYRLGRHNEIKIDGNPFIRFQPVKKGSAVVTVPITSQLRFAIDAVPRKGSTYLLSEHGRPYASAKAFANKFAAWVEEAGLEGLTSHGIRKSAGQLLALAGATQYHIMSVHGHTEAKTSEVYTKGVDRARLAAEAISALSKLGL
ncbi:tyrosine-type recombinase/integrase [Cereibacter sphaeroides]|uniref:tyrosine-type recombinase/integrase n=1 Tax=Cereibacter sphaeroides TaxID=1063 RepID=UPI001F1AC870|nr:tyrosine-type recombinase/integrase [Cereibacter sphaeroides]MCE6968047.1 tyrosine-type recombinase/integrase [Cereibacter sphaeroides]